MESFAALLGLAVTLFVSTNADDLVVLVGFFADHRLCVRDIVAGQYAGLAVLFVVSVIASLLSLVIPGAYLGLLGIFPILIGVKKLIELRHHDDRADLPPSRDAGTSYGNIHTVALVTMANGGDNIGIYTPAFAISSGGQIAVIGGVFVVMTALWCVLAHWMVTHPKLGAPLRRYAHLLAPVILIGLGVSIIYNAGSVPWLLRRWVAGP
jgi:cadmium resistance protein CadD (predicted permease)